MSKINYWNIMTRKKPMPVHDNEESKFNRLFSTFDLTALGVSATLGVGVYVLAGHVAKLEAGPSVILSFLIAAAASFLAGLCYAEFASRVPKSGSAYVFTYVAIGEFIAFIIGWNLLLEYIIGSASIAKGLSLYIDSLINDTMKNSFRHIAPITYTGNFLSTYFDFFAFTGPLLLGFALAFGLRKSAGMNNILCVLNLFVVLFVVIVVLIYANLEYWRIDPADVPAEYRNAVGKGGFFPFGFSGTLKGAATCFFGFVGFDCIATTGEEVENPRKTVPRAILYSLIIIFLAYFGVSLLTLMWPYYLLDAEAPLPHAFGEKGLLIPKWIVTIGGIVGLIASLFGAMFPLPRILYAMSVDGLLFKEFGVISKRFKTPVMGTLSAAFLTSCFAGLFELAALVNMLSIGVLLAYTVVAISIIILRFSQSDQIPTHNGDCIETSNLLRPGYNVTVKGFFMQLIRMNSSTHPNTISTTVVGILILSYCFASLMVSLLLTYGWQAVINGEMWALVLLIILSALLVLFALLISIQPKQNFVTTTKPFMVPFVPFLPAISVFINIYLMLMLDYFTWIRFGIWMLIGFLVYFPYAWFHHTRMNNINDTNKTVKHEGTDNRNENEKNSEEFKSPEISNDITSHNIEQVAPKIIHVTLRSEAPSTSKEHTNHHKHHDNYECQLAIQILDTVLEDEEESEYSKRLSKFLDASIEDINENQIQQIEEPKILPKLKIIDTHDLQLQLDEILEQACEIASEKVNEIQSPADDDDNVFQNEKFLTHLSDLIMSNKSAQETQTLHKKKKDLHEEIKTENEGMKHSSSAPDLQEVLRQIEMRNEPKLVVVTPYEDKFIKEGTKDPNKLKVPKVKLHSQTLTPPQINKELFAKFDEIQQRKAEAGIPVQQETDSESSEDDSVDKVEFKEKLEKLLSLPPTRMSFIRPVPLPRTSLQKNEEVQKIIEAIDPTPLKRRVEPPATPMTATMQKQKQMFDEVLKNIKKDES
ncbi:unnamed protein product [Chironomus riparius]|uniref:Cationic amino acid transporter C-terminal domain-containing protein n=1 Tax=Chironomus riparius TaxID=315576 RepID=A0A9N9WQ05_9DIPT|nr:unnamed protein product [Chironomus riparius]